MFRFNDKTILITGAAGGLGRALAREFHRLGSHLALVDINSEGLENLRAELNSKDRRISLHCVDVADEQALSALPEAVMQVHGSVDVLLNNAGVSISRPFETTDPQHFKHLFDVNFWGALQLCRIFLPILKTRPKSMIVNVISDFALMGFPGKTSYGASKSALMGFSYALYTELTRSPVSVHLIIPPPLDTDLVKNSLHGTEEQRQHEINFLKKHGMPLESAAATMVRQLARGRFRIVVGSMMFWIDTMSRLFPTLVHRSLRGRIGNLIKF